jgi:hypothetical protein
MSQNTHKGMTGHRRPVNQKNGAEKTCPYTSCS